MEWVVSASALAPGCCPDPKWLPPVIDLLDEAETVVAAVLELVPTTSTRGRHQGQGPDINPVIVFETKPAAVAG